MSTTTSTVSNIATAKTPASPPSADMLADPLGDFGDASHGPLSCADVEALLAESSSEVEALRDQIAMMERVDAARQGEMDALRQEGTRIRAVLTDTRKSMERISSERSGMDTQVKILTEELEAAERDALPVGTLTHAAIPTSAVATLYRSISRVTRGPLPPSMHVAVSAALPAVAAAMQEAGHTALEQVVRREVRRRRAQSATRRPARQRASAALAHSA